MAGSRTGAGAPRRGESGSRRFDANPLAEIRPKVVEVLIPDQNLAEFDAMDAPAGQVEGQDLDRGEGPPTSPEGDRVGDAGPGQRARAGGAAPRRPTTPAPPNPRAYERRDGRHESDVANLRPANAR